jgi:hypothetical protein
MLPLMVVHLSEPVELSLLQSQCQGYGVRSVPFESPMHPFVASVLLRPAGLNALAHDTHLHPMHQS